MDNLLRGGSCVSLCNIRNKSNWIYFQGLRWLKCTDGEAIALSISVWALYQRHCSIISFAAMSAKNLSGTATVNDDNNNNKSEIMDNIDSELAVDLYKVARKVLLPN